MSEQVTSPNPQIRLTGDGSHTLYLPDIDEHYHSHFGALTESTHIFINAGLKSIPGNELSIMEVGFGTGLNALLTAMAAEEDHRKITYTSLEKYPLPLSLLEKINHSVIAGPQGTQLFNLIHAAPWGEYFTVSEWFKIKKIVTDLVTDPLSGEFDLIYFDAFGPDKQPEMWSRDVLEKVAAVTRRGSVFVTYSAKGTLKRMLRDLGFEVTLLPGPPGKRVMTRAVKK